MITDSLRTLRDAAAYKTEPALAKSPTLTAAAFAFSIFAVGATPYCEVPNPLTY